METKKLDETTLKFAIQISQQFETLCKKTKQGVVEANAYSRVQEVLKHYLQEINNEDSCIDWNSLINRAEKW